MPLNTQVDPVEDSAAAEATTDDVLQDPLERKDGGKPKRLPSLKKLVRKARKLLNDRQAFFEQIVPLNEGGDWTPEEGTLRRTMLQVKLANLLGREWIELQMILDNYDGAKTNAERRSWLERAASQLMHIQERLTVARIMGACTAEAAEMLEALEAELLQLSIDMRTRSYELVDERDIEAVDQIKSAMRDALVL